jgi:hypothetical protein
VDQFIVYFMVIGSRNNIIAPMPAALSLPFFSFFHYQRQLYRKECRPFFIVAPQA